MNIDNMSFIRKLLAKTYGAIRSRIQFQIARMRLFLANNLQYGAGSRAYGGLRTRITDGGSCILGKNVTIERNVELSACKGVIYIGSDTFIGQGSVLVAHNKISIGKSCLIAEYVSIRDQNHEFGASKLTMESGFKNLPINIGDNVWIGAKASVLAGVNIGQNSVVGAGSVVTRDIPENSVVVGVPGRIVKSL